MSIATLWKEFKTWWTGTTIGGEIDTAGAAAKAEIEEVLPEVLEGIVSATSAGILNNLSGGTATAIAAGIADAEAAFKTAGQEVTSSTLATFVSTLHSSIISQQAAGAVTPAAG